MTDDPRRRHLTPEEAAELRRRARESRGYADPGAPRDAAPRQDPRSAAPREPRAAAPRDPRSSAAREPRAAAPRDPRTGSPRDPRDPRGTSARAPRSAQPRDPRAATSRDPRAAGAPDPRAAAPRRTDGSAADPRRSSPREPGRAGYQPRQTPEQLSPEERARYAARGYREPGPNRDPRDPRDPRSSGGRADARDPYRQPTDRRGVRSGRDGRGARDGGAAAVASSRTRRPARAPRTRRFGPLKIAGLVLVLLLTLGVVTALWADSKLERIDALVDYPGRIGNTPGTVTLLVGTDSREGLTEEQQAELSTGSESDAGGKRTDTMMLVFTPRGGDDTMLISLPRDMLVDIPGYGENKLNAAYTFGGPALLTQTLEQQTGVRIDHYAEIGFGGFAGIVDAVGGVEICLDEPINDPYAGLDLAAGCQILNGPQSLGFVRTRYGFAEQDLQRVRNQRQFLGSLMRTVATPGNMLNPFTAVSLLDAGAAAVTVDTGDHIWSLASVMRKLSGDPLTVTVPNDGMESGDVGSYLVWGPTTTGFFDAIASGKTPGQEFLDAGA